MKFVSEKNTPPTPNLEIWLVPKQRKKKNDGKGVEEWNVYNERKEREGLYVRERE